MYLYMSFRSLCPRMMDLFSAIVLLLYTGAIVLILLVAALLFPVENKSSDGVPKLYYKDTALARHIMKNCPKLRQRFRPPVWARSTHFQTVVSSLLIGPRVTFQREILTMSDGGTVALDWAEDGKILNVPSEMKSKAVLFLLPGLTGDAKCMKSLCKMGLENGYRPVVFNKRGHGGKSLTTPKMQSFGDSSDVREVLEHLRKELPGFQMVAVGLSAGSALLVSYLCDFLLDPIIQAGVCISAGYDSETLFCTGIQQPYEWILLRNLKKLVSQHKSILSKVVDMDKVMQSKTICEFDEQFYCKIYGYPNLKAYWSMNNPMDGVENVEVPVLCISSLDDLVCQKYIIPFSLFKEHPAAMLVTTDYGGHLGFLEVPRMESWADKTALEYLNAALHFLEQKHS